MALAIAHHHLWISAPARCRSGCCLRPRDYLSTFVKLGVIVLLAVGIVFVRPELQLPAFTRFTDGTGPDLRRQDFSVLLHHHRLRRDFRLPLADFLRHHAEDDRQGTARLPGRLRLHAARKLRGHHGHDCGVRAAPGRLFRSQFPGRHRGRHARGRGGNDHLTGVSRWAAAEMQRWRTSVGERTLFYRTGGAPSLALGMAHIFARGGGRP